jgi:predicted nucleic acid-binding protein
MSADRVTLDSNILVYSLDRDAGERHRVALDLVERAADLDCVLTLQALAEFFAVVTRKAGMPVADAAAQITDWQMVFEVRAAAAQTLSRAIAAVSDHRLAFWDAMLWACAKEAGCKVIFSEDFQHGRTLEGVRFLNPFIAPLEIDGP